MITAGLSIAEEYDSNLVYRNLPLEASDEELISPSGVRCWRAPPPCPATCRLPNRAPPAPWGPRDCRADYGPEAVIEQQVAEIYRGEERVSDLAVGDIRLREPCLEGCMHLHVNRITLPGEDFVPIAPSGLRKTDSPFNSKLAFGFVFSGLLPAAMRGAVPPMWEKQPLISNTKASLELKGGFRIAQSAKLDPKTYDMSIPSLPIWSFRTET